MDSAPTIALVAAEPFEVAPFLKRLPGVRQAGLPIRFARVGKWKNRRIVVGADGAGPRIAGRVAALMIERFRPEAIWSVGLCGALEASLGFSQVVAGSAVIDMATGARYPCSAEGWSTGHGVVTVSQDRIASSPEEKRALSVHGGIVEMEAAGVARTATAERIPFGCVKVVSDVAGEGFALDLNTARDAEGRVSGSAVFWQAVRRPQVGIHAMIHMWRSSREAAERLGEFLGDSRA